MNLSKCRPQMRKVAFWTIVGWIGLVSLLITLMIWGAVDSEWVSRVIWTATTLTVGILLICLTIQGFAAAEREAMRKPNGIGAPFPEVAEATHLREAMERAKEESGRH